MVLAVTDLAEADSALARLPEADSADRDNSNANCPSQKHPSKTRHGKYARAVKAKARLANIINITS